MTLDEHVRPALHLFPPCPVVRRRPKARSRPRLVPRAQGAVSTPRAARRAQFPYRVQTVRAPQKRQIFRLDQLGGNPHVLFAVHLVAQPLLAPGRQLIGAFCGAPPPACLLPWRSAPVWVLTAPMVPTGCGDIFTTVPLWRW